MHSKFIPQCVFALTLFVFKAYKGTFVLVKMHRFLTTIYYFSEGDPRIPTDGRVLSLPSQGDDNQTEKFAQHLPSQFLKFKTATVLRARLL